MSPEIMAMRFNETENTFLIGKRIIVMLLFLIVIESVMLYSLRTNTLLKQLLSRLHAATVDNVSSINPPIVVDIGDKIVASIMDI